jgi:hypothetical protein
MLDQVGCVVCYGVPLEPSVFPEQCLSSITERGEHGDFEERLYLRRRADR